MTRLTGCVLIALALAGCASGPLAPNDPAAAPMTRAAQAAMTPDQALARLKDGNLRFVQGRMLARDLPAQVRATGGGQYPFATVLSCIDSRAAPELVFDQGVGDVFAARVAGSRLVVVLGHTGCGAIKGACDDVAMGNLTALVAKLRPAVASVSYAGDRSSKNNQFVEMVAEANVRRTVQEILQRSPILRDMAAKGEIKVVGAMLDVSTGVISWY